MLVSSVDHPVQLFDALTGRLAATYYLQTGHADYLISPKSLVWTSDGRSFLAGASDRIFLVDMEREYRVLGGPTSIASYTTKADDHTPGITGNISALSTNGPGGLLAAGTSDNFIGLYEQEGWGSTDSVVSLDHGHVDPDGRGITSLRWSPDGRYLFVAKRMSDKILLFDIRYGRQQLTSLEGRNALTQQRLDIDVVGREKGVHVWAGGMDGRIVQWIHPQWYSGDAPMPPTREWMGHDGE